MRGIAKIVSAYAKNKAEALKSFKISQKDLEDLVTDAVRKALKEGAEGVIEEEEIAEGNAALEELVGVVDELSGAGASDDEILDALETVLDEKKKSKAAKEAEDEDDESKSEEDDEESKDGEEEEEEEKKRSKTRAALSGLAKSALGGGKAKAVKSYAQIFTGGASARGVRRAGGEKERPGLSFARAVKCAVLGRGDPEKAARAAKSLYPDSEMEREFKALSVTSPADGGVFVPKTYSEEIIPLLYARAVITQLGARRVPMPSGNLTIPKMISGSRASYQGEMRRIKATQPTYGDIKLSSKKLAAIVPVSNDLFRSSATTADEMFLNDLLQQMTLAMDYAGLYGAGDAYVPIGVYNAQGVRKLPGIGEVTAHTPGLLLTTMLSANPTAEKVGWVFNTAIWGALFNMTTATGDFIYRDEMQTGKLLSYPFAISNQIPVYNAESAEPTSDVFLGDWNEFIIGEQADFQVDYSRDGVYHDMDGNTVSSFEQDTTLVRVIGLHDFNLRHPETFVVGTGVSVNTEDFSGYVLPGGPGGLAL
jgi:HK97 family phage major capsid protein